MRITILIEMAKKGQTTPLASHFKHKNCAKQHQTHLSLSSIIASKFMIYYNRIPDLIQGISWSHLFGCHQPDLTGESNGEMNQNS